jgi:hypothetical protein
MTRGLYQAANLDAAPTRLTMATYPVQCVGWAADTNTLYACQKFWFGTVDQMTGEFKIMMRFTDVSNFVTCPGEDPAAMCKTQLCLDYCGPAHFAIAPVCSAYDEPSCGKPVALMEADETDTPSAGAGGAGGGTTGAAGGGTAGAIAGAGGMSIAGATATAGTGAAGSAGSATAGTAAAPAKSSSGCSCSVPMGSKSGQGAAWVASSVLAAIWLRRRARRSR